MTTIKIDWLQFSAIMESYHRLQIIWQNDEYNMLLDHEGYI